MPSTINDWPGVTDTIVTSAGLAEMIRGLTPEQLADLQQRAQDLRAGHGPEKIDRSYLRFPDAQGDGQSGQRAGNSLAIPGSRQVNPAKRAFMGEFIRAIIKSPNGTAHLSPRVAEPVRRALSEGSDGAGGYLVPPGFLDQFVMDADPLNQVLPYVRRLPVSLPAGWLPTAATNPVMTWGVQGSPVDESDPAFGQVQWNCDRLNALVTFSRELVDDSTCVEEVMRLFQAAIAEERDRVIVVGTGSGQPMGLYSASGIYDTGITELTYANLAALKYAVDARYHQRRNFRWVMNPKVLGAIIGLTDTVGRPIFREAPVAGQPATILGTELSLSPFCPDSFLFAGDLSYYLWFDRQQVTVEKTIEAGSSFVNHQMMIKFIERVDGKPGLPPTCPMVRTTVLAGIS